MDTENLDDYALVNMLRKRNVPLNLPPITRRRLIKKLERPIEENEVAVNDIHSNARLDESIRKLGQLVHKAEELKQTFIQVNIEAEVIKSKNLNLRFRVHKFVYYFFFVL